MARKVQIDFDLDEIKAMVQGRLAGQGLAGSASSSQLASLYHLAVQRLETPLTGRGTEMRLELRQEQLEEQVRQRQEQQQRQQMRLRQQMQHRQEVIQQQQEREQQREQQREALQQQRAALARWKAADAPGGGGGFGGQTLHALEAMYPELTLATTAVGAFAAAAIHAGELLTMLAQGSLATGSTPGGFAFARAMGGAAGLSPEGTTGMLQSLRQRIATDPFAMAEAGQYGVRAYRPGIGPVPDMGAMFSTLFGAMAGMSTARKQQFAERIPEMQPFLAIAEFGRPDQIERVKKLANELGKVADRESIQRAIDLNLAHTQLGLSMDRLTTALGTSFLPMLERIVKLAAGAAEWAAGPLNKANTPFSSFAFGGAHERQQSQDKHTGAIKEHTDAMLDHAAELRLTRNGVFGGGARAQGAIPPGLRGQALQQALDANAVRLGAF